MTRFLPAVRAVALAATLSIAGLAPAGAAPLFVPTVPPAALHVVQTTDGDGIGRDGARVIRRDRHRRGERHARPRHEGHKQAQRRHEGHREAKRRHHDNRYALRRDERPRLGYDRNGPRLGYDRDGTRLGYNRSYDRNRDGHDNHRGPKFIHPDRDDRRHEWRDYYGYGDYGHDDWNHDRYRHKPRLYKMESYGYKTAPANGALKDVLTAVPD